MAGTYPQYSEPHPGQPGQPTEQPPTTSEYPGMLPPPLEYPKRRRWHVVVVIVAVVAVFAAVAAAIVYGVRTERSSPAQLTTASASTAIQGYLDAMSNADVETIARNTLCGMYDAVRDKRSDQALAKLASDAFRKQFRKAQVTSVDKMVYSSPNQAQVLFTMRVTPPASGARDHEEQAVAQLLEHDNQILVCSYLLRTATVY